MPTARPSPRIPVAAVVEADAQDANRRLRRNRILADALLAAMAVIFAGSHFVHDPGFATLLARAGAEAGLVGGIADWFAVTALFRHPLGIPIPHTAIIPNSKDRIARTIGRLIERYFLTADVILARLRSAEIGRRFAGWLAMPSSAAAIAGTISDGLPYLIESLGSQDLLNFANRTLGRQLHHADIAPVLARILRTLLASGEGDALLDRAIDVMKALLEQNRGRIEQAVQERSRWWIPKAIDREIATVLIASMLKLMADLQDPTNDARQNLRDAVTDLIRSLETSPERRRQINAAKNRLLDHPNIQAWLASLWTDLSELTIRDLKSPTSQTRITVERGLLLLGQALETDEAMQKHIDSALERLALYVTNWRGEIGSFFADVVRNWDTRVLTDRLQLIVGSDLQYIRMNGTVVGALIGCVLFLFSWAVSR
jgi:uncharacterized membrane-anchored protein YjiN (DUF445 family)